MFVASRETPGTGTCGTEIKTRRSSHDPNRLQTSYPNFISPHAHAFEGRTMRSKRPRDAANWPPCFDPWPPDHMRPSRPSRRGSIVLQMVKPPSSWPRFTSLNETSALRTCLTWFPTWPHFATRLKPGSPEHVSPNTTPFQPQGARGGRLPGRPCFLKRTARFSVAHGLWIPPDASSPNSSPLQHSLKKWVA